MGGMRRISRGIRRVRRGGGEAIKRDKRMLAR